MSFVQLKIGFHCRPFRISLRVGRRGEGTMLGRGMMEDGEGALVISAWPGGD